MSLRVWLPLNGSLENKGLSDINLTGSPIYATGGKIGNQCLASQLGWFEIPDMAGKKQMSFAYWVKINTATSTNWLDTFSWYSTNGSTNHRSRQEFYTNSTQTGVWFQGGSIGTVFKNTVGDWNHYAFTIDYDKGEAKFYINGEELANPILTVDTTHYIKGIGSAFLLRESTLDSHINDFRLYDHILSSFEVKQISQGLVLHYPLNSNSIQILNNCYTNPCFETSGTGWNRWGSSGHQGSGGWTDDQNYCFRNDNTGAYWVANGAEATKNYLLYQSPAFEEEGGGFRSLQCICKEENGIKITDNVCFPAWNSRNGGVPTGHWTSIENLGNGFYLCKCEGISQSGSDNLIGVYIKPGYKVYFSEIYVENYRTVCSDIFFTDTTVYDTSGYNNNGTAIGNLECSSDTPRYDVSTHFGATNSKIRIDNLITTGFSNSYTFSWWGKYTTLGNSMFWGFQNGVRLNGVYYGIYWNTSDGNSNPIYKPGTTTIVTAPEANVWHHYVMTGDNTVCKLYVDGELYGQAKIHKTISGNIIYINGWDSGTGYSFTDMDMSDFRIYATALSPEDVLDLYNLGAAIDTNNNLYGIMLEEV